MTSTLSCVTIGIFLFHCIRVTGARQCSASYRASVYEHVVRLPLESLFTTVSRKRALLNMMKNLKVYKKQAALAAAKKANILVFPEDGVYGMLFTRQTIKPYLEYIPDPNDVSWNPCSEPGRFENSDVQRMLSCMAKNNRIFIVANIGDRQPCDGPDCPDDGQYQYNTDVVYDDFGNFVARYHKTHLFEESQFDTPNNTEFVTFDTPFGKFGVFTCYDILFKSPAVDLVKEYGVRNFVFPTAWGDKLPQLSAIGFHSSFARGMKVNLMSSNIHMPTFRMLGSGIFTPDGAVSYYYDDGIFSSGKLLFANICYEYETVVQNRIALPAARHVYPFDGSRIKYIQNSAYSPDDIRPFPFDSANNTGTKMTKFSHKILSNSLEPVFRNMARYRHTVTARRLASQNQIISRTKFTRNFLGPIANNRFHWLPLSRTFGTLTSCTGKTCCYLQYSKRRNFNRRELYAFGIFDGYDAERYTQICSVVKCQTRSLNSCGSATKWARTKFKYVNLRGQFSSSFIFPEVIAADSHGIGLDDSAWVYKHESIIIKKGTTKPVLCMSLLARVYRLDKNP